MQSVGSYLIFNKIEFENAGKYHCTAKNMHGKATKTAEIIVHPITNANGTLNCNENEFKCRNSTCIPIAAVCDGILNCAESEDEANCRK